MKIFGSEINFIKMEQHVDFDNFCYVCGKRTIVESRRKIGDDFAELYNQYFNQVVYRNVEWAPSVVCTGCLSILNRWKKGKIGSMPFGVPMIWSDPQVHTSDDCYACLNFVSGTNRNKLRKFSYRETKYTQLPLPHSENIPIPGRPSITEECMSLAIQTQGESLVSQYQPSHVTNNCNHLEITQNRLDIMVRRLKLSQRQSILLAKELKQANILAPDALVYGSIGRHRHFTNFFKSIDNNSLAFCIDIRGLILTMHHEYKPEYWRLFIDSSKSSLKAVLLHMTNTKNSVPIALSTNTKETYLSLKKILDVVKYNDHNWKICADLKVIALLRGMQTGYTKNMCFMCLWDTRYKGDQYEKHDWPLRETAKLRVNNIVENPLVSIDKVLLPPLHIKLGIVKNFIKALIQNERAFNELSRIFPRLSNMKIKEGLY